MDTQTTDHSAGMNGAVVRQIKAERGALGLTVEELAAGAKISSRSLMRYLNFERPMTLGVTEQLAQALGISYETLIQRAWTERQQ